MRNQLDLNGTYLLLCEENHKVRRWNRIPQTLE